MAEYANGGLVLGDGVASVPVKFTDREKLIYPDGKMICYHAGEGRFHDHGERFDRRALLEHLNKAD